MGPKKASQKQYFGTLFLWDINGHSIEHLLWSCMEAWRARLPRGHGTCLGVGYTGMAPTALRADPAGRGSSMYLETLLLRASGGLVIHRTNFRNLCLKPGFPIMLSRIQRFLEQVPGATYRALELSPFYGLNVGVPSN